MHHFTAILVAWGLRSYGTEPQTWPDGWRGELGQEPSPGQYVEHLVAVFEQVRRVLRPEGLAFLNLGDSFSAQGGNANTDGIKPKDLCGIPWRVALALQEAGWYLRCDLIWAKAQSGQRQYTAQVAEVARAVGISEPQVAALLERLELPVGTCMPSSVKDRPTISHEYIFMLAKSARYFYDSEAVKEKGSGRIPGNKVPQKGAGVPGFEIRGGLLAAQQKPQTGRNLRSVLAISPKAYKGAHFASFSPDLIEPLLLAGTSEKGACRLCGAPWRRVVEDGEPDVEHQRECGGDAAGSYDGVATKVYAGTGAQDPSATKARILAGMKEKRTTGWKPTCECVDAGEPVDCLVLDPFCGTGTVGRVALTHGRRFLGIDVNPTYVADLVPERMADVQMVLRETE